MIKATKLWECPRGCLQANSYKNLRTHWGSRHHKEGLLPTPDSFHENAGAIMRVVTPETQTSHDHADEEENPPEDPANPALMVVEAVSPSLNAELDYVRSLSQEAQEERVHNPTQEDRLMAEVTKEDVLNMIQSSNTQLLKAIESREKEREAREAELQRESQERQFMEGLKRQAEEIQKDLCIGNECLETLAKGVSELREEITPIKESSSLIPEVKVNMEKLSEILSSAKPEEVPHGGSAVEMITCNDCGPKVKEALKDPKVAELVQGWLLEINPELSAKCVGGDETACRIISKELEDKAKKVIRGPFDRAK